MRNAGSFLTSFFFFYFPLDCLVATNKMAALIMKESDQLEVYVSVIVSICVNCNYWNGDNTKHIESM